MATYLAGANLVIKDRETGEEHNSPIVWNKYARISQYMAELPAASYCLDAALIKRNPTPIMMRPTAILNNDDDSRPFNFQLYQNPATDMASVKMKNALTDWNTEAGI
jgi:hypothetical protein